MCSVINKYSNSAIHMLGYLILYSIIINGVDMSSRNSGMSRGATMFGRNWGFNQNGRCMPQS